MKKVVITTIKTYDKEVFELSISFDKWLAEKQKRLDLWKKSIPLTDYQYELFFSNILSVKTRTRHIEEQKKLAPQTLLAMSSTDQKKLQQTNPDKYYQMERKEAEVRKNNQKIIKEQLENWKERRTQNFIKSRRLQLKKLAATERVFWLKTTEQKLIERERYTRAKQMEDFKKIKK